MRAQVIAVLRALDTSRRGTFVGHAIYRVGRRTRRDVTVTRRRDGGWNVSIEQDSDTLDLDEPVLRELAHLVVDAAEKARAAS